MPNTAIAKLGLACRRYIGRVERRWPGGIVTVGLGALAAGLTAIFGWVARQQELEAHMPGFVGLVLLAGILYVIGVFLVNRYRLGASALIIILASGILIRLELLPSPSTLSDDVYRYQWEGRVQREGLNPYVVFPDSPDLDWLQNPEHPEPPGEETPSPYPPLSEVVYRLVETVPGYKRVSTLLDLSSIAVLMMLLGAMKRPLHRVLAYAWNPTILIAFALSGHFDSLAIVMLVTALLFLVTNRPKLSVGALALAFLSKFFPIVLLPAFLKRTRLAYAGLFLIVVIALYLPYASAGLHLFGGLTNYARDWENNASLFRLVCFFVGSRFGAKLIGGLIVLAASGYLMKKRAAPVLSGFILTAGVLLLSPTAYPWYFTWSIPFLCFYPSAAWLLMSVATVLAYTPTIVFGAGEPIKSSLLMLSLEYGPVYVWLVCYWWVSRRAKVSQAPQVQEEASATGTISAEPV